MYRHGDILLVPVPSVPQDARREDRNGNLVVAQGEATGHSHRIEDERAERWLTSRREAFLVLPVAAEIRHEEHRTLTLPPGTYRVVRQREYRGGVSAVAGD